MRGLECCGNHEPRPSPDGRGRLSRILNRGGVWSDLSSGKVCVASRMDYFRVFVSTQWW